ncbi:TnsA-like heteromeric transposase endonuclease subunit [Streptomyces lavendulocolor]|uniref:TnsA-like heteromeric transposase endonuclease subunit n=1 Tax=Streptomyces lavendulocolor TaxID=67316 RepID=UPI003C2D33F0
MLSAFDLDFFDGGRRRRVALGAGWDVRFEDIPPVRGFRWNKGERSFPGWYCAVTTGGRVGYESWLERDRLILLDFAPDVVGIASQPFWLHWQEGEEKRRHAPDYFVRLADGRGRVVAPPSSTPVSASSTATCYPAPAERRSPDASPSSPPIHSPTTPSGRATVRRALNAPEPSPENVIRRRPPTVIEPIKVLIDPMIDAGLLPKQIWDRLYDEHGIAVTTLMPISRYVHSRKTSGSEVRDRARIMSE